MKLTDFEKLVGRIAKGKYFSVRVELATRPDHSKEVTWSCYVEGLDWGNGANPGDAILDMQGALQISPEEEELPVCDSEELQKRDCHLDGRKGHD